MNTTRIDELAAAWSAEDPDPALRTELEALLLRDPTARRRFLDHCVADMALAEALGSAAPSKSGKKSLPLRPRQKPTPRRAAAIGLWAAGIAAMLLVGIWFIPAGHSLRVTAGSVVADGRTIPAGGRVALPLRTATAGDLGVVLDDPVGIALSVKPGSTFTITAPGAIQLDSGHVTLEVDGKRAPPTAVRTRDLVATVMGTGFSVSCTTTSTVEVRHGTVRVTTSDQAIRTLTAGMHIEADQAGFVAPKPATPDLPPKPPLPPLQLILIAADGSHRPIDRIDQPIRLAANQPFSLRRNSGCAWRYAVYPLRHHHRTRTPI